MESKAKKWIDPVKNRPAKESTLNAKGDFQEFAELMKRVITKKTKPSSSPVPDAS